jgi:hypothetical protein
MQSPGVTLPKAANRMFSMSLDVEAISSFAFRKDLTAENVSSMGFRSGCREAKRVAKLLHCP